MKTSLDHLPEHKRAQITAVAALLSASAPMGKLILFGSYARGDWVEDLESHYISDFDFLASSRPKRRPTTRPCGAVSTSRRAR